MPNCVFCNSKDNISTTMEVKTDRGMQEAHICAACEDDASPKRVRAEVEKKNTAIVELEEQAKALGYELVPIGQKKQRMKSYEQVAEEKLEPEAPKEPAAKKLKKPTKLKPREIKTPSHPQAPSYQSYNTDKEEAPEILEVEEQVVIGRGGQEIAIPKRVVSEGGTTDIQIVDSGGDRALQERFKNLPGDKAPDAPQPQPYQSRDCTFCKGTGITAINGKSCPRCKGAGTV